MNRRRLAAQNLAKPFFDQASQRGMRSLGFLFCPQKEVVSNIYGCLHMGNHIKCFAGIKTENQA